MIRKTTLVSLLIGVGLLVSCFGNIPSIKTLGEYQKTKQPTDTTADSYTIGPGDLLSISVWKEPELSKEVAVRLDGKMSLPLLNDIQAAGFTCAELHRQLTEKYKDYVDFPEVLVTLVESRSSKIYILGKITRPGEYALQKSMTVLQAISLAGGLSKWADTSDIRLTRKIEGVEKTFRIDCDAIVSGKDLAQNVQLQADDTIFVP